MAKRARPRQPTKQTATVLPNPPKQLPGIEVPARVIDALVGYGLRTQEGQTLMHVWRDEHAEVHSSKGAAQVLVGPGRIVLVPLQEAPAG